MLFPTIKKLKNNFLRVFGYALVFFGVFMLIAGIGIMIEGKKDDGPSIAIISLIFFIPGAVILYQEKKSRRQMELMETVSGAIRSYRRIKIEDIATKCGISIHQTEKIILKAISAGMIEGNFDRTTGEFFIKDAEKITLNYRFCPNCGSPFDRVYLIGETVQCSHCGMILHTKEASHGN